MSEQKRLTRSSKDAMLGGVAGGIAEYFNLDPTLVRLAFVLLAVFTGVGIVPYIILWLIMPTDTGDSVLGNWQENNSDKTRTVNVPANDLDGSLHMAKPIRDDMPKKAKRSIDDAEAAADRLKRKNDLSDVPGE